MTAVRFVDSAKYGFKFLAYLVVVTAVGGGVLGLGAALAWPEVQALRGASQAATTELAAGGVLAFLGAIVLLTGYFGSAYKLIADAVAAGASGVTAGSVADDETTASASEESSAVDDAEEPTATASQSNPQPVPGPEPTEAAAEDEDSTAASADSPAPDAGQATSTETSGPAEAPDEDATEAESEPDESEFQPLDQEENPPEPTAEEIAFGTTPGGDGTAEEETVDAESDSEPEPEPEETDSSGAVKPAGKDAPTDPLGDRGD